MKLDSFLSFLSRSTHMLMGGGVIGYARVYMRYIPIAVQNRVP